MILVTAISLLLQREKCELILSWTVFSWACEYAQRRSVMDEQPKKGYSVSSFLIPIHLFLFGLTECPKKSYR